MQGIVLHDAYTRLLLDVLHGSQVTGSLPPSARAQWYSARVAVHSSTLRPPLRSAAQRSARRRHSVQRLLGTRDRRMDGRSCRPHAVHMARVDFVVASVVSRLARVDSVERHRLHRRRHATHDASRKFAE